MVSVAAGDEERRALRWAVWRPYVVVGVAPRFARCAPFAWIVFDGGWEGG